MPNTKLLDPSLSLETSAVPCRKMAGVSDVGGRLREMRQRAGLSQRQLALLADVSNTTISLIELNRSSPSVGLLHRVLASFSMTLGDFFGSESVGQRRVFREDAWVREESEGVRARVMRSEGGARGIELRHLFVRAGAHDEELAQDRDSDRSGLVVRGIFEITIDGVSHLLRTGDAFQVPTETACRFGNPGNAESEVVLFAVTAPR